MWRSGLSGTIHNYISKPCYSGDPLQNTMIASLVIYKKGMTEEEVNTVFDIESTIVKLDAAYALNDGSASIRAVDLQNLVDEAKDYAALAYPGLDALNEAITAAEAAIAGNNVTEEDIDDLKTAIRMYRFTQPASGAAPADFTFAIENPSFEGTFGGKLDPNSIVEGDGSYKYPTGWTLYMDKTGWCNAVDITAGPPTEPRLSKPGQQPYGSLIFIRTSSCLQATTSCLPRSEPTLRLLHSNIPMLPSRAIRPILRSAWIPKD